MAAPIDITLRRIVIAMDASPHAAAALEGAARFARVFGAELAAVFVEDVDLIRAASSPFAREVGRLGASSGDLTASSTLRTS